MGILDAPSVSKADVVRETTIQVGSSRGIDYRRRGPVATDVTSVVQTSSPDASMTQSYLVTANSPLPATYPVEFGVCTMNTNASAFGYIEPAYPVQAGSTKAFYTDAPKLAIVFAYATSFYAYQIWIDGAPVTLDPVVGNGNNYLVITFPSGGKARLVEIYTKAGIGSIYMPPPYRAWKPKPKPAPKILVMGDSYAMTTSFDSAGNALPYEFGIYHRMGQDLGTANIGVDGIGGTGYIRRAGGASYGAPNNNYADRMASAIALNPDVVIVHGGGANDLLNGSTRADVIAAATTLFQGLRTGLPNAKLVFVEGFAPPAFTAYAADYVAISAALRTALANTGVYYIDVATTSPWLNGLGYYGPRTVTDGVLNSTTTVTSATAAFTSADVGCYITGTGIPANAKVASVTNSTTAVLSAAATATATGVSVTITKARGDGNSDIYVGPDGTHLKKEGSDYIRSRMADRVRVVMSDNGALLNQLI